MCQNRVIFAQQAAAIQSPYFTVCYDESTGRLQINRTGSVPFIEGLTTGIHFSPDHSRSFPGSESVEVKTVHFAGDPGNGRTMILSATNGSFLIQWEISVLDSMQAMTFETRITNLGTSSLALQSIEPFSAFGPETAFIRWPDALKCLTNGAVYYDAGIIHTFGDTYRKPEPYGETKGGVIINDHWKEDPRTVQSWWNIGIFSGYDREGLSLGYIENQWGLGRVQALKKDEEKILVAAESVFSPGTELAPGQTMSSDRFMVSIGPDPYRALEDYAGAMASAGKARTGEVVNGWCNWFYTLNDFGEDEILQNAAFAARHLKPFGLEYIQIDEGFQTWHGEWEGNREFPHGLKWLATRIRQMGLKPGIWISPFVVSGTTTLFRDHPEWFLKNGKGNLQRVGPWPGENTDWFRNESPERYALDITHPGAEKWFADLIDTIVNNWGFEMIKVDFVAWSVLSAHHYYDRSATPAQVYSKALQIIRETAGDKCHLLECGPGNISIGSISSMRIEYDQNYGYAGEAWKQYFLGPSSSAGAAGKRYYYHSRTWTNDADHVCIDLLSDTRARAAATMISLTGGNMMSGDRLIYMDNTKLEILKKVFPAAGVNAKPVDLFDTDPQLSFAACIKKDFDRWTVAGFFNPDLHQPVRREFPLDRLWLDPAKKYLVYDFWNERFLGEITGSISVVVHPGSVLLVSIHEKKGIPQFISTTRHTMQGKVELEDVRFDDGHNQLSGTSTGPGGSSHDVIVYLPEGYSWSPSNAILYEDHPNYSVKMVEPQILRVRLKFTGTERITWSIDFSEQGLQNTVSRQAVLFDKT